MYPCSEFWFSVPHLSDFVFNTPLSDFRFSYPYTQLWFLIPLSRTLVFRTPCWNFVLLYHFKPRFLVQFPYPVSFYFSVRFDRFLFVKINFILMILNVYHIIQKIVKFLSEMSVFCQNLWYNVYSDNFRAGCSRIITSSFLIHGNSSSKTYLANRSFLFVPTKGTLLNGTPTKRYVFDSLRFTIVLSTQIGK